MTLNNTIESCYRTGDLAYFNEQGVLEYVSRKDSQIKIAGRRIEIKDIELSLRSLGFDVIVVPCRNNSKLIEYLVAYSTRKITNEELLKLRNDSVGVIEKIFFPHFFVFIESIPTTASGKTDRKKLEILAAQRATP
jgi:acyl-coenzyme A synthetase/AMP-(fatty) acid ligase